ncbi:GNAT family N-acetyltransferase [Ktedonosporobacter rubrisoli]|uniref:GNAT family N-acetyltransferase n=1 Tax=Ktedonosporobacter rubrisoli TaxID=2509675 RepID=A0A4P6JM76_KTERU|nr:GNAT family N-acetyltransferase [Ktedonosporobacter rubrisoli]QBD76349.1 GNAT family N-acetyltransferase [Ktedonosporobacter rubrisoli]
MSLVQGKMKEGLGEADHAHIRELLRVCHQFDGLEFPLSLEGMLYAPNNVLLCYQHETLLGMVYVMSEGDVELLGLVHPEYRRQGVGRSLLEAAKTFCRRKQVSHLSLVCFEAMPAGEAFCRAVGGQYEKSEFHMVLDMQVLRPLEPLDVALSLRQADAADARTLAHFLAQEFEEAEEEMYSWIEADLKKPGRRAFLVVLGEEPIGTLRMFEDDSSVEITAFGILPPYRRHGYGRRILLQAVHMLLTEGWQHIALDVETENRKALALYLSCGFRQTREDRFYRLDL